MRSAPGVLVEACVDSVEACVAAERGGARRLELCDSLVEGGTTPSPGMVAECLKRVSIPINVMIRPRGGEFLYSRHELAVMRRDIVAMKRLRVHGVVFGVLKPNGTIDTARMKQLVRLARPLSVTCHRAIDVTPDPIAALDTLIRLGVNRVLTSGQRETALEGAGVIAALVERSRGRIVILAGCGVDGRNARQLVHRTGVTEVHLRGTSRVKSGMRYRSRRVTFAPPGGSDYVRDVTDAKKIRAVARSLTP
ncbi:MAG TPA: copper homeostasis protein CutC [Gemmatimonadales bacterium]